MPKWETIGKSQRQNEQNHKRKFQVHKKFTRCKENVETEQKVDQHC